MNPFYSVSPSTSIPFTSPSPSMPFINSSLPTSSFMTSPTSATNLGSKREPNYREDTTYQSVLKDSAGVTWRGCILPILCMPGTNRLSQVQLRLEDYYLIRTGNADMKTVQTACFYKKFNSALIKNKQIQFPASANIPGLPDPGSSTFTSNQYMTSSSINRPISSSTIMGPQSSTLPFTSPSTNSFGLNVSRTGFNNPLSTSQNLPTSSGVNLFVTQPTSTPTSSLISFPSYTPPTGSVPMTGISSSQTPSFQLNSTTPFMNTSNPTLGTHQSTSSPFVNPLQSSSTLTAFPSSSQSPFFSTSPSTSVFPSQTPFNNPLASSSMSSPSPFPSLTSSTSPTFNLFNNQSSQQSQGLSQPQLNFFNSPNTSNLNSIQSHSPYYSQMNQPMHSPMNLLQLKNQLSDMSSSGLLGGSLFKGSSMNTVFLPIPQQQFKEFKNFYSKMNQAHRKKQQEIIRTERKLSPIIKRRKQIKEKIIIVKESAPYSTKMPFQHSPPSLEEYYKFKVFIDQARNADCQIKIHVNFDQRDIKELLLKTLNQMGVIESTDCNIVFNENINKTIYCTLTTNPIRSFSVCDQKQQKLYTQPDRNQIARLKGLIDSLLISNQFGQIFWQGPLHVTDTNFENYIKIGQNFIEVYPSEYQLGKPPVGKGLNRVCQVTFKISQALFNGLSFQKTKRRIAKAVKERGNCELIDISQAQNFWKIRILNF